MPQIIAKHDFLLWPAKVWLEFVLAFQFRLVTSDLNACNFNYNELAIYKCTQVDLFSRMSVDRWRDLRPVWRAPITLNCLQCFGSAQSIQQLSFHNEHKLKIKLGKPY